MMLHLTVSTGELTVTNEPAIITSHAIGSCVAVALLDPENAVGGMAHVMMPGTAPPGREQKRRYYAVDALSDLYAQMLWLGAQPEAICAFLIGGANVLRDPTTDIGEQNVASILGELERRNTTVLASHTGGFERMTATLNLARLAVTFSVGDAKERELWSFTEQDAKTLAQSGQTIKWGAYGTEHLR